MPKRKCPECGESQVVKKYRHVESVGGIKVSDETAPAPHCGECGNVDLTSAELAGYERRAAAVVLREVLHAKGPMVRYARKALRLKQDDLAKLLFTTPETISRWENDRVAIQRAEQLAIVALIDLVECRGIDPRELLRLLDERDETEVPEELEVPTDEKAA